MDKSYPLPKEVVSLRLDKALTLVEETLSRGQIKTLLDDGHIRINGVLAKTSYRVKEGDIVDITIPEEEPLDLEPVDLNLHFVYEDNDLLVVDKPSGLTVHPAQTVKEATLVHGLLAQVKDMDASGEDFRPGIVHRIDKDTSGLLVVAKNKPTMLALQSLLQKRQIKREYVALVEGVIAHNHGKINAPIGRHRKDRKKMAVTAQGRPSITHFQVIERFINHTLVVCQLESGRTHQIRVHMLYIGHPLVGDPKYGHRKTDTQHGQYLHAKALHFVHPSTKKDLHFESPLPEYFTKTLESLRQ